MSGSIWRMVALGALALTACGGANALGGGGPSAGGMGPLGAGAGGEAGTGAGGTGGLASAPAHSAQPLWLREFPCSRCLDVQLAAWPNGEVGLLGDFSGTLALGAFPIASAQEASFIARVDAGGTVRWARLYDQPPTGHWEGWWQATEPGGALYVGAAVVPEPYEGVIGAQVITKIGADGALLWSRAFELPQGSWLGPMAVAADGTLSVFGTLVGTFDFGGGPLTARSSNPDNFVLRLDPDGQFVSAALFADASSRAARVAVSSTGLLATIGAAGDNAGGSISVFDAAGSLRWNLTLTEGSAFFIAFAGDDVVVALSVGAGTALARFDRTGQVVWKRPFGNDDTAVLSGLAVTAGGNIVLSGFVSHLGNAPFAFGSIALAWAADPFELGMSFVGELDAQGEARWAQRVAGASTVSTYSAPLIALDSAQAVHVAELNADTMTLVVGKYAP